MKQENLHKDAQKNEKLKYSTSSDSSGLQVIITLIVPFRILLQTDLLSNSVFKVK